MATDGFEAATLARVVAESGIPMSSVYHYYGSKDGILLAVMERGAERFFADLPNPDRRVGLAAEHLRQVVATAVATLERHPSFLRLLIVFAIQPPRSDAGEVDAVVERVRDAGPRPAAQADLDRLRRRPARRPDRPARPLRAGGVRRRVRRLADRPRSDAWPAARSTSRRPGRRTPRVEMSVSAHPRNATRAVRRALCGGAFGWPASPPSPLTGRLIVRPESVGSFGMPACEAEGVGFEPTVTQVGYNGFRGRSVQTGNPVLEPSRTAGGTSGGTKVSRCLRNKCWRTSRHSTRGASASSTPIPRPQRALACRSSPFRDRGGSSIVAWKASAAPRLPPPDRLLARRHGRRARPLRTARAIRQLPPWRR